MKVSDGVAKIGPLAVKVCRQVHFKVNFLYHQDKCEVYKRCLHWQRWHNNAGDNDTWQRHTCTCLGYLGRSDRDRIISFMSHRPRWPRQVQSRDCRVSLMVISHCDIILLCTFVVGSTSSGSAFVIACHLAPKLSWIHLTLSDNSSPYIYWSGSWIRISHTFVLFKHVTLIWINYLETWLRSDNTSCYYSYTNKCCPCKWSKYPWVLLKKS
jgi:hypothetical protein